MRCIPTLLALGMTIASGASASQADDQEAPRPEGVTDAPVTERPAEKDNAVSDAPVPAKKPVNKIEANRSRYHWHNGHWWYEMRNHQWMYWNSGRWELYNVYPFDKNPQNVYFGRGKIPGVYGSITPGRASNTGIEEDGGGGGATGSSSLSNAQGNNEERPARRVFGGGNRPVGPVPSY